MEHSVNWLPHEIRFENGIKPLSSPSGKQNQPGSGQQNSKTNLTFLSHPDTPVKSLLKWFLALSLLSNHRINLGENDTAIPKGSEHGMPWDSFEDSWGLWFGFFARKKDEYFIWYMVQKLINVSACGKPSSRDKFPHVKFFKLAAGLVWPTSPRVCFV